ncbi:alpha/beta fold hydrolase [Actinomadura madurae]|uniref:alpha/beta fold hydrolase n=1 Tax=Actinomadura madurae TaxID=1993 RepID=UPI003999EF10
MRLNHDIDQPSAKRRRLPTKGILVAGTDGAPVQLHDLGGDGPALLLAHATGFHGLVWHAVAEFLTPHFHCWSLDFRGHGDSPVPDGDDLSWEGFGRDVSAALSAIPQGPVVGVGHSLGGAALAMAQIARSDSFEHLFMYEPALPAATGRPPVEHLRSQEAMVKMAAARRMRYPSIEEAMFSYARKQPMSSFQSGILASYVDHGFTADEAGGVRLKCLPETEAQIYAQSYEHDIVPHLDKLSCSVTVAVGTLTEPIHRTSTRALAERLRSELVKVDGVDHFGPMQQPRTLAHFIRRAMNSRVG